MGVFGYCESGNHVWAIVRLLVGGSADSVRRRRDLILIRTCCMVVPLLVRLGTLSLRPRTGTAPNDTGRKEVGRFPLYAVTSRVRAAGPAADVSCGDGGAAVRCARVLPAGPRWRARRWAGPLPPVLHLLGNESITLTVMMQSATGPTFNPRFWVAARAGWPVGTTLTSAERMAAGGSGTCKYKGSSRRPTTKAGVQAEFFQR